MTFTKVLIANRGEIAMRILRACRELGIKTVAVYSEADRSAMHVRYADEAYLAWAVPFERILFTNGQDHRDRQARAKQALCTLGMAFFQSGPLSRRLVKMKALSSSAPKQMPSPKWVIKAFARATVKAAGVPVVPGTESEEKLSDEDLLKQAPDVGFPLLIKATAGGGGKGMRQVNNQEEMAGALESARRESKAAFGDDNVYLEKMIVGARHIEIQVLGDNEGNIIHLGERECSIQRRHQKLLEEAPSPFIQDDEEFRQKMGAIAIEAAKAVDYVNAGTIEFLVDKDKNFYFLEMNTRLQVEHPVTEYVTGVDIVKEQIRIARGRQLGYTQEDVKMNGWAIECRINAEDPYNNFMPSTGVIQFSSLPTGPGVRVDTGVYMGFHISPYYDSLISKLIVWGETRGQAILRMRRALEEYRLVGVVTNIPFHQSLLEQHRFIAGNFDTKFVEDRFSIEKAEEGKEARPEIAAILATLVAHQQTERAAHIIQRGKRDTSNWKWVGRWERMHR